MSSETDPLFDLAAAVADGARVDWAPVEEGLSGPEPKRLVEQFRLIARIAGVHRSQGDPPEPAGNPEGPRSGAAGEPRIGAANDLGRWGELILLEEVGQGSFGTVYRAHDPQLDRQVAVKLLRPTSPSREQLASRLLQEGRTLAQVRHPNVVTVYGAGDHEGRVGLWMEFVRGLTLEQMLARHGRFSAREAGVIGHELCGALAAVHYAGLVHRDVKAQNVMREEGGRLVLMDFGAGQKRSESGGAGRVVGTPLYLAPEVLAGAEATIQSDIYSLGVLLYHLVTNDFPVKAATLRELRAAHERGEAMSLQDARPDLQSVFVRAVGRAIDSDPARRFPSARQMEAALAQLQGLGVKKAVPPKIGTSSKRPIRGARHVGSDHRTDPHSATVPSEPEPSIAVLPFANLRTDQDDEYFSDGLTEEIINVLAQIPGLRVTARTSAFALRGKEPDIRKVAEVLGVRTILEGSVRRAGTRVRVTAQLVSAADGYYLWSERYERETADVFAIQDEIAMAIAAALQIKLALEPAARRRHAPSLPAYEAYLKAQYHQWKFTPESLARSKELYENALRLDPQFALAQVGRAAYFLVLADRSFLPAREAMPLAREAARKALDIDPSLPDARAVLGVIAGVYDYDWAEAERQFKWAMASDPIPPLVRHWYGFFFLGLIGRFEEAIVQNQRALQQDPLNLAFRLSLAMSLRAAGRMADAEMELRQILEIDPRFSLALMLLSIDCWARGRLPEAIALAEEAYQLAPSNPQIVGLIAGLVTLTGDLIRAETFLQQLGSGEACGASLGLCLFNVVRGDLEHAVDWVEKAIEQRHPQAVQALNGRILRTSPRCSALAKMVNLPDAPNH
jgi:TolB-like protein/Tfp pilus assembly protein PilF